MNKKFIEFTVSAWICLTVLLSWIISEGPGYHRIADVVPLFSVVRERLSPIYYQDYIFK